MRNQIKFGTDGWRAIMNDRFTFSNVRLVTQAIALFLMRRKIADKGVVIGYDARFMSERFAREVCRVLAGNGIPSYLPQRDIPTPVATHAILVKNAAGAIIITASHNPPEYNGIKFMPWYASPAGADITSDIEEELARLDEDAVRLADIASTEYRDLVTPLDTWKDYLQGLKGLLKPPSGARLPVVADPMYGSGRGFLEEALGEHGATVESIHNWRDALFGGSRPEPSAQNLAELRDKVVSTGAVLGLATDGDADRFGVVDRDGTYITPNQLLSILLWHLVQNRGWRGPAVRTVTVTHLVDAIAADLGIEVIEKPVGFKWVGEVMRTTGAIIGGEESGGLSIRGHIPEKDGIIANCLALEVVDTVGTSLGAVLQSLYDKYGYFYNERVDVEVSETAKSELIHRLSNDPPPTLAGKRLVNSIKIDGVKLVFDDGDWLLARPSGTEDLVRIYLETRHREDLAALKKELWKRYQGLLPPLSA